jgi:pyruvate dehydrogenase E1 component
MYGEDPEDIYYYLTIYNEPYVQPAEPEGLDVASLLRGMYLYASAEAGASGGAVPESAPRAQLLASGVAMQWALRAAELLRADWGVHADVWSVTSWNELRRDAVTCEEANLLDPSDAPRVPFVAARLADSSGPVVAVSDFMRAVPDQISRWVPTDYTSLGTDGFGFADTRGAARRFFHVDAESIVLAVLTALAKRGEVKPEAPREAIDRYKLLDVAAAGVGTVGGDA